VENELTNIYGGRLGPKFNYRSIALL